MTSLLELTYPSGHSGSLEFVDTQGQLLLTNAREVFEICWYSFMVSCVSAVTFPSLLELGDPLSTYPGGRFELRLNEEMASSIAQCNPVLSIRSNAMASRP